MYVTTITIGRNFSTSARPEIAGTEMSEQRWDEFQRSVADTALVAMGWLESAGWETYLSQYTGRSFYQGEAEDSAIFQILHEIEFDISFQGIRDHIAILADTHGQDCIAVILNAQADLIGHKA